MSLYSFPQISMASPKIAPKVSRAAIFIGLSLFCLGSITGDGVFLLIGVYAITFGIFLLW